MSDEIKEIIENSRKIIKSNRENGFDRIIMLGDDIDKLLDYITNLQNQLQQKENIIKEVNELIEEYRYTNVEDYGKIIEFYKKLKTILDKENNEKI